MEREGTTASTGHSFNIDGYEIYIEVTANEKGELVSVKTAPLIPDKSSWIPTFLDMLECTINRELCYGIPLESILRDHLDRLYWPNGQTSDPDIPHASSLEDYICRYLGSRFIPGFLKKYPAKPMSKTQSIATMHWR